ncbi:MAG: hypothetical protein K6E35_02270 [Bacteroidales bacterium]|nr:hypothetical protein [Bacteroidales bacterium]
MSPDTNKDWMDALREKAYSEGASPAPASWEAVGRRVRRGAALRRAGITAGVLLPVVALLLWASWHRPVQPAAPVVAQSASPAATPVAPPAAQSAPPAVILSDSEESTATSVTADSDPVLAAPIGNLPADATSATQSDAPAATQSDAPVVILSDSEESPAPLLADASFAPDPFAALPDAAPRHRSRISIGVRAGSGARMDLGMQASRDYVNQTQVMAHYLSSLDPERLGDATKDIYALDLYNNRPAARYHHDLPLTLGLSVRMDLTPRMGLESGLEYTYLHSVEELGGQTLEQRHHLLGIPVRADVRLWSGRLFDIYFGLGGKMEKCVYAILGRIPCEEPNLLWSAGAFAGVQYRLGRHARLYFQPEMSYYFTQTELVTYRTEHPLSLTLHAGLRWDL